MNSRCAVCQSVRCDEINALLAAGVSMNTIEAQMKAAGHRIKAETISRHFKGCLEGDRKNIQFSQEVIEAVKTGSPVITSASKDFAELVHEQAVKQLKMGRIHVTTKDGMAARALLDRREERAENRQFIMNLAQLLAGGGQAPPQEVIEGEFQEVLELEPGESALLAPAELRE